MKAFIFTSNLGWFVLLTTIVCFTLACDTGINDDDNDNGKNMISKDDQYKNVHPDLNNVTWPLVEELTLEIHKNLCHEILSQVTPPDEDVNKHVYKTPEAATIRKSRVLRNVPLHFRDIGVHYVPVIVCTYEDMKMYLTNGDDKHVFRLDRDKDNIFYINSGPHPMNISV